MKMKFRDPAQGRVSGLYGIDFACASGNPSKFNAKQLDTEFGLYYYGARYYDPATGRFTAPDPLTFVESPYAYCGNNPASMVDPTGMKNKPAFSKDDMPNMDGTSDYDIGAACRGAGSGIGWGCTDWRYDPVSGKYVRYWYFYYTSSLTDASGCFFSNYDYQLRRAARHLNMDLAYYFKQFITRNDARDLSNWWNAQMRGDGDGIRLSHHSLGGTINGESGFVFEAYGQRNGKKLEGTFILYYNGHILNSWNFVSGPSKAGALPAGEYEITGEVTQKNLKIGMYDANNFGWKVPISDSEDGTRIYLRIHPSLGTTEGCIGITGESRSLYNWFDSFRYIMTGMRIFVAH